MRTLFVLAIRLLLLAGIAFLFVVLYEHGPKGFVQGIPREFSALATMLGLKEEGDSLSTGREAGPYQEPELPSSREADEPAPVAPDLSSPGE